MVISITWLVFLRFFSLSSYFSSLSMLYSGRRCHAQPTLMGWEVATYVIWNSFVWEICLFSPICVFIYSIIYFYQYGLMNIYFQVWVLFQCILIFCSNYSSFGHWKFLQLVLLSLSHIQPLCFVFVFLSTFFLSFFFLWHKMLQAHLVYLLPHSQNQSCIQGALLPFIGTKIWALGVLSFSFFFSHIITNKDASLWCELGTWAEDLSSRK